MTPQKPLFIHISIVPSFKPGDMPPEGYLAWHEWAEVQRKAGIKQVQCGRCCLWNTPQELSGVIDSTPAQTRSGKTVMMKSPVCLKCNQPKPADNTPIKTTAQLLF